MRTITPSPSGTTAGAARAHSLPSVPATLTLGVDIGGDRPCRRRDLRRIGEILLRVVDLRAGQAVGVAALERHLHRNAAVRPQLDTRGREVHLVGLRRDGRDAGTTHRRQQHAAGSRPRSHRLEQIGEPLDLELGHRDDFAVRRKPRIAIEAVGRATEFDARHLGRVVARIQQDDHRRI